MAHSPHGAHHLINHIPVEPVAAIVLAAAGVTTSWAGYQASLWDGIQLVHYGQASAQRVAASRAALDANLTRAVEVDLFQAWAEAKFNGESRMALYYEQRFPAELREAFTAWMKTDPLNDPKAPPSPFAMPSYRPQGLADAAALEAKAEAEFQEAIQAKHKADAYVRAGVVLASAMFFAGIGQIFKQAAARLVLASVAVLALVLGMILTFTLPVLSLMQLH